MSMSMSDLAIDIEERLSRGEDPYTVAEILEVPTDWVLTVFEWMNGPMLADAGEY